MDLSFLTCDIAQAAAEESYLSLFQVSGDATDGELQCKEIEVTWVVVRIPGPVIGELSREDSILGHLTFLAMK